MASRKVIRQPAGAFTNTVKAQRAEDSDRYLADWDRKPGGAQRIDAVKEREKMGKKMTPIGRGTLIKKG